MRINKTISPINLLVVIVDRYLGEAVTQILEQNSIKAYIQCLGHGTAESEISDLFGFGIKERDIVLSFVVPNASEELLQKLNEEFKFTERHNGLAFTVPINSAEKQLLKILNIKVGEKTNGKKI